MRGVPSGKHVLIVGLGNPGGSYAHHRHNVGFMVLDALGAESFSGWKSVKEKALVCDFSMGTVSATLIKPQTYMNLSGRAVVPALKRLNADPSRMIVIHDDLDLAFGRVRIKVGGGDGGHKGIRSIADALRFRDFVRIRVGIGRPPEGITPEAFVLSSFQEDERSQLPDIIDKACAAVRQVLEEGVEKAQNVVHSRRAGAR